MKNSCFNIIELQAADVLPNIRMEQLESIAEKYEALNVDALIEEEFRQNPRWKHILGDKGDVVHFLHIPSW